MIAIVGGGLSGLALGVALAEAGADFRIYEARSEVGGVVRTLVRHGHTLELGPQRLRGTPDILAHLEGREIRHVAPVHGQIFVVRDGRLHPLPRTLMGFLRSEAVSARGKARAALEPLMTLLPERPGDSAAAVLRRRLGAEVYRTFAGPLLGGLYGSDPEEIDAGRTLRPAMKALGIRSFAGALSGRSPFLPDAPVVLPVEGMVGLPRALAERIRARTPDALRTDTPVQRIRRHGSGRFRLESEGEELLADALVLTTPPPATARLLAHLAPDAAHRVGTLRMNPIEMVHLEVPELPKGLGFKVALGEGLPIRGATWSGNLDGSGRTAVVYLDPTRSGSLPGHSRTEAGHAEEVAAESFASATGIPARPLHYHRAAMPAWDRSWRALDPLTLPRGVHLLGAWTGRPGIPGRLAAGRELAGRLVDDPLTEPPHGCVGSSPTSGPGKPRQT